MAWNSHSWLSFQELLTNTNCDEETEGECNMCQSNAYLIQDGKQQPLLEDVVAVKPEGDKILLSNIFGEQELVDAKIKIIDLLHHKIILEKRA